MADKTTEKVKKLQHKPEQIRNIAIAAHIDHGKCIAPESRIMLDGNLVKAKDLFETAKKKGEKVFEEDNKIIYDTSKLDIKTFSLNKKNKKLEKRKISHAWKLKGGNVIKLKLRNGFQIKTTPEHKYIVFENFDFKEKQAKNLKIGDRVICPREIEIDKQINIKSYILKKLQKENFYVFLNEVFGNKLKNLILDYGIRKINKQLDSDIKYNSIYHGFWKNRYQIKDLIKISHIFNFKLENIYNEIDFICYRTGKWRDKSSLQVKLPKTPRQFEKFFYLSGLMFGDGSGKKFVVGKKELGNIFEKICDEFNIRVTHRDYGYRTKELMTSETLSRILKCVLEYPLKDKSRNIKISSVLWKIDKRYVSQFIKGYFDTDGCVEKSRRAISLSSASKKMLKGLSLLLLRIGIVPNLQKNNIFISGHSAKRFQQEIGFNVKDKTEKLEDLVKRIRASLVMDYVLVNGKRVSKTSGGLSLQQEKQVLLSNLLEQFAFVEVKKLEQDVEEEVYDFSVPKTRNFVSEGIIIHNTTFSDNLLAGAGMMSEELAGKQLVMDFHDDEKERGITIDSANVSMVHDFEGKDYLINLIDTPGHVDFGGDVTRAMRAVDGSIVLVCASEGVMPQTETVLRQALRERVKPILFINKVDRLIREVKLTPEQMQKRFKKIINQVNELIHNIAPKEYKDKWLVNVQDGSVAFGSAFHNWALSIPFMKKNKITFSDIIEAYKAGGEKYKELAKKAPLHRVVLNMVTKHLPDPKQAQPYRIPKIWHGDLDSKQGKSLTGCDENGKPGFISTKIVVDKHAGEVAAGRLFSGTLKQGDEVYMNLAKRKVKLQQVFVYNGAKKIQVDSVVAGNIVGLSGLTDVRAGETVSEEKVTPFEEIKHIFEPVVTKSIEAKKPSDLPNLIDILRTVNKEDPSIHIEINEDTGENLISGMGELHLEVIENRIRSEKGLDVKTGQPIVVYNETVTKESREFDGRSPNKHNIFTIKVEPLEENIYNAIKEGEISEGRIKKKDKQLSEKLREIDVDRDEVRQYRDIYKGNVFLDTTRGEVYMEEVIELILDAFEQVVDQGPLAREPCSRLKVSLTDVKLHEDAIHRGPAQVYPAVRNAIHAAMNDAKAVLFEPVQIHRVEAPLKYLSNLTNLISSKRGELLEVNQEQTAVIKAKIPVAEMIGWSSDLRSATEGRGVSSLMDQKFEKAPADQQQEIIKKIRDRKGLEENQ